MKYDQHFLIDEDIIILINKNLDFIKGKVIVEIGPGKGAISSLLKRKAKQLKLIEFDEELISKLKTQGFDVIWGDAVTKIDHMKHDCIVSNLPYSITEPLFKRLLKNPKEMLLITGKNFGNLLGLETKFGLAVKSAWDISIVKELDKESFNPPPSTKSLLIKLVPKKVIGAAAVLFNQHDKKVKNALINYYVTTGLTKREAKNKLSDLSLSSRLLEQGMDKLSTFGFKRILELV